MTANKRLQRRILFMADSANINAALNKRLPTVVPGRVGVGGSNYESERIYRAK